MMGEKEISEVLSTLLKVNEIHASMFARRNEGNVLPDKTKFTSQVNEIWDVVNKTTDNVFDMIQNFSSKDLGEIKLQLQDYTVLFYILSDKENAIVSVFPSDAADVESIEIEMDRTRQEIESILNK